MGEADSFIGQRFGKDGHLEVICWNGSRTSGDKLYTVVCNVCCKDAELFGEGTFNSPKATLVSGSIPCGCAKTFYWSQEQYVTRVERKCKERNYDFLGFHGDWKGSNTKLSLRCHKDGHMWNSTKISNLMTGNGCPVCGNSIISENSKKPESKSIEDFMSTGKFHKETVFWKSDRRTKSGELSYWKYSCPKCSNDEYVKLGLCKGVFEAYGSSLQKGQMSCRCSPTYRWTRFQREYQVRELLVKEGKGVVFKGWKGDFLGSSSRVILQCVDHGEWDTTVTNLLRHGSGCSGCAKYGFDRSKEAYLYVLKVVGKENEFAGYGISNKVNVRLRQHKFTLAKQELNIVESAVFLTTGQKALDVETSIKYNFPTSTQTVQGFKREATDVNLYYNLVDFIKLKLTEENHVTF